MTQCSSIFETLWQRMRALSERKNGICKGEFRCVPENPRWLIPLLTASVELIFHLSGSVISTAVFPVPKLPLPGLLAFFLADACVCMRVFLHLFIKTLIISPSQSNLRFPCDLVAYYHYYYFIRLLLCIMCSKILSLNIYESLPREGFSL